MMEDQELLEKLHSLIESGKVIVDYELDDYFVELENKFILDGSKIDWEFAESSVEYELNDINDAEESKSRLVECAGNIGIKKDSRVILIGDAEMEYSLKMSFDNLLKYWEDITAIPQHLYIFPEKFVWCICLSLEGYFSYGLSPRKH